VQLVCFSNVLRDYGISVFRKRDDFYEFLLRAFGAIELAIMNLIDSINEYIIVEYDGPNGILTSRDLLFFGGVVLFSLDPK